MNIQPIVEGHGEVQAVPVLLRRLLVEAEIWGVGVGKPIRRTRSELATEEGIARSISLAHGKPDCAAILVLFDSDDDCPALLGPKVQEWADAAARGTPCAVCIAHREYEAWFLATLDSIGPKLGKNNVQPHPDPESPGGAKGQIRLRMMGRGYKEIMHQPKFSDYLCLSDAFKRSRSFRKLVKSFGALAEAMGESPDVWPPPAWLANGD